MAEVPCFAPFNYRFENNVVFRRGGSVVHAGPVCYAYQKAFQKAFTEFSGCSILPDFAAGALSGARQNERRSAGKRTSSRLMIIGKEGVSR